MKNIVDKLHEDRQVKLAKAILESKGYVVKEATKVKSRKVRNLRESYSKVDIEPFRSFTKSDFYEYAGANLIGESEPLIFNGESCDIIISGHEDGASKCVVDVYTYDDSQDYGTCARGGRPLSFSQALELGKELASIEKNFEELIDFCDEKLEKY